MPDARFDQRDSVFSAAARGELGSDVERWAALDAWPSDVVPRAADPGEAALAFAAFRLAYHLDAGLSGGASRTRVPVADPAAATVAVKRAARFFGADIAGVAPLHPAFVYSHDGRGEPVRVDAPWAVVVGRGMDFGRHLAAPGFAADAATGRGYADVTFTAAAVAFYIRLLGYDAAGHRNGTVLQVPLAVAAGLGELGRCGFLVTPRFGPRLRLASVTTDLPLVADRPTRFGVDAFCHACRRCAEACPARAIPVGEKTMVRGVLKWRADAAACLHYWAAGSSRQSARWHSCARCIAVCPWNKPDTWYHRVAARAARHPAAVRPLLLLDGALGFIRQRRSRRP